MPPYLSYEEQQALVAAEVAKFPGTFGMRGYPGKLFKVCPADSYYSEVYGVLLYVHVQNPDGWCAFAKGDPEELQSQIVNR